jgi:hypothetical protein
LIEKSFGYLFVSKTCIFIKEYLATPWRVAVKYCHFLSSHDRPRPGLPRVSPRPHTEALETRLIVSTYLPFFQRKVFSECPCHDATMTLTMCFDEQIIQGKVHDYFDTSKVYFTMPNIIFRTRTMSCELAPLALLCRPLLDFS